MKKLNQIMTTTLQRGVAKQGLAGVMGVLLMKDTVFTESKFLSIV